MTMRQKKGLAGATLTSALALTVLVAGGVMARSALETVHIELVVEEMAFRGPGPGGSATPVDNPTLEVRTGQSEDYASEHRPGHEARPDDSRPGDRGRGGRLRRDGFGPIHRPRTGDL